MNMLAALLALVAAAAAGAAPAAAAGAAPAALPAHQQFMMGSLLLVAPLVAQALGEPLTLLTGDPVVVQYSASIMRV